MTAKHTRPAGIVAATSRGPLAVLGAFSVFIALIVIFFVDADDEPSPDLVAVRDEEMVVYKTPWCECCEDWTELARESGFAVEVVEHDDLAPVRARLDVPDELASCHTAEIGGYVVEGHVPIDDIDRLLAERPDAVGLALPGMVPNSPGMEVPDGPRPTFQTFLFDEAGNRSVFAIHRSEENDED